MPKMSTTSDIQPVVRYVCVQHGNATNWRGRGCTECAPIARRRRDRRPETNPTNWSTV